MKTVICPSAALNEQMAERIQALLRDKPDALIALSAGRSTAGLYKLLSEMCGEGRLSFAKARIFAVTEYVGAEYEHSCRAVLERELINNIDLDRQNFFLPDEAGPENYDLMIEQAGGIDLAVLGIGINGHIGYNEPATPFDSLTHIQKLTDATHRQYGAGGRRLTEYALTMGIKTLVSSRSIFLLATGREKADAVFKMIYGKTMSYVPASFLQIPLEVTAYLDGEAAEKL